ncbi:HdeD family acid-resistance protein [Coprothermobacter platensis]|uniref:HdeD family acid-resistance protein n=1 Tax=Coprothermobacter platensis TaxID=108819 RepID=UPI00036ECCE0|nr:DUF308 domain-containing protein [Coprothermobacter platensis]
MQERSIDWASVLIAVFMLVIGVLVLSNPAATITTLAMFVGIAVLVTGVILLFNYKSSNYNLAFGIIAVILGIFLLARPAFAVGAMAFIIGIWFVIEAVQGLTRAGVYRLVSSALYTISLIANVVLLILGILILIHPFVAALSLPIMAGIALILGGLVQLVSAFSPRS